MSDYYYGVVVSYEAWVGDCGGPDVRHKFAPGIATIDGKAYEGVILFKDVEDAFEERKKHHKPEKRERASVFRIELTGNSIEWL